MNLKKKQVYVQTVASIVIMKRKKIMSSPLIDVEAVIIYMTKGRKSK